MSEEERRRQSDRQFETLSEKIDIVFQKIGHMAVVQAEIKKDVSHTLDQALRTNGRVKDVELDVELLDKDHRQLRKEHDGLLNKAIGWSACFGCVIAILVKLFWH